MQPLPGVSPALQHVLPSDVAQQQRYEPSSPSGLLLRLVLIVCVGLAGLYAWSLPAERSVDHLLAGLSEGTVDSLTIERFDEEVEGYAQLRVDWTQTSGRDGYASYEFSNQAGQPRVDEGARILAAAERSASPVDVTEVSAFTDRHGVTWDISGMVLLGPLLLLVFGPQPRLGTKWAWFWLSFAVPLLWVAFLVLEPVPAWRRRAMTPFNRRMTGGWAFLLALLLGPMWQSITPL